MPRIRKRREGIRPALFDPTTLVKHIDIGRFSENPRVTIFVSKAKGGKAWPSRPRPITVLLLDEAMNLKNGDICLLGMTDMPVGNVAVAVSTISNC